MKNTLRHILALGLFLVLAVFAIQAYYTGGDHIESAKGGAIYFLILLCGFLTYEWVMLALEKKERSIWVFGIVGALLGTILITSIFTYTKSKLGWWTGLVLFFQVIRYALFPLAVTFVATAFGLFALKKSGVVDKVSSDHKILLSIGLGLSAFMTINVTLGFVGIFNIWSTLGLLVVLGAVAYKEIGEICAGLWNYKFQVLGEWKPGVSVPAVFSALMLLVLFVLISVNLTNVVRPYPIGWDDLGVYMNYPRIMVQTENTGWLGMALWQSFTAIGQMINSAPQAFFFNQIGSLLAICALFFGIRTLIPKTPRYLSLPLLASTIFMAMPMVIFQQAKDMKLDPGLFGISVIALVTLLIALKEENDLSLRNKLIFISGLLISVAFAIKFTSLMLIISAIAIVFYAGLGLAGFAGFTGIFVAIFTQLRLWDFLNVNYPKDNPKGLMIFSGVLVALSLACLVYGYIRNRSTNLIGLLVKPLGLLCIALLLPLLPWFAKNITEAGLQHANINGLLNGKSNTVTSDYHEIYTPTELQKRKDTIAANAISVDGKSQNEDLGRYFGYEDGINNYLKLPANLTTQTNQGGEFTDITYLYLALVPGAVLLFGFGSIIWLGLYALLMSVLFGYFFVPSMNAALTAFFNTQSLPFGYLFIVAISVAPFLFVHFWARKEEDQKTFRTLFAFTTLYTLLFIVAAFGIVWYGILMYFCFLAIVVFCFERHTRIETDPDNRIISISTTTALLLVITPFFLLSCLPHAWNNIPTDSIQFKSGEVTQDEAIFLGHPDYLPTIARINLKDESVLVQDVLSHVKNEQLKKYFETGKRTSVSLLAQELMAIEEWVAAGGNTPDMIAVGIEAKQMRHALYNGVLVPKKDKRNQGIIYRIGTFLTYYISENRKRYFEDSLIMEFDRYIVDSDPDKTVERMKKLGMKYLLVDLNAATIDRDPRHDLTRRFEWLLNTLKSDKLQLIATDSLCLRVALENRNNESYMNLAGVNYRSYVKNEKWEEGYISAEKKLGLCHAVIAHLIFTKQVSDTKYGFLKNISDQVLARSPASEAEVQKLISGVVNRGWMASFAIQD